MHDNLVFDKVHNLFDIFCSKGDVSVNKEVHKYSDKFMVQDKVVYKLMLILILSQLHKGVNEFSLFYFYECNCKLKQHF